MTNFQIIIVSIFAVFAVAGVLVFSGIGGLGEDPNKIGKVVIWGTVSDDVVNYIIGNIRDSIIVAILTVMTTIAISLFISKLSENKKAIDSLTKIKIHDKLRKVY